MLVARWPHGAGSSAAEACGRDASPQFTGNVALLSPFLLSSPQASTIRTICTTPVAGDVRFELHGQPLAILQSPDYTSVADASWQAGDALGVSALGADVAAFSGTLLTPLEVTGLGPPLQQTPVVIVHDAPLRVSWQPEARDGETMLVLIEVLQTGGSRDVRCTVADGDGQVTVDPRLLAPLVPAENATVHLVRSISSSTSSSNATIALDGEAWLSLPITIE